LSAALALAFPLVLTHAAAPAMGASASPRLETGVLEIVSGGTAHRFNVEIADQPAERQKGLMYRHELAADAGMLFDFGEPQQIAMWMKNTYIPLDMLFIAADGSIRNIAENTVPFSLDTIPSRGAVRFVLEVPAGTAARLGLKAGDRVRHSLIGNP
jgi:hypothetical protein